MVDWPVPFNFSSGVREEVYPEEAYRRKVLGGMIGRYRNRHSNPKFYFKSNYTKAFDQEMPYKFPKHIKKQQPAPFFNLEMFDVQGLRAAWNLETITQKLRKTRKYGKISPEKYREKLLKENFKKQTKTIKSFLKQIDSEYEPTKTEKNEEG